MRNDRRDFQRLKLAKPILAMMDQSNALILDIGMAGALLEHYGTAEPEQPVQLLFRWQGEDVRFVCKVTRTSVVRHRGGDGKSPVSHTGVRFEEAHGPAAARLRDLMTNFVGRILKAQRANAAGEVNDVASASILATLGDARRKRVPGYVSYRLKDEWWRVPTASSQQPEDGFTVPAWEDEAELEALCRAYEESNEEGRHLIRLVAELSVRSVLE